MASNVMRWKKDAPETGLRRVGAGPRGSKLRDSNQEWAWVHAIGGGWHEFKGWYFVVPSGLPIPYANSCRTPVETEKEAKQQAMEYVKKHRKELGV